MFSIYRYQWRCVSCGTIVKFVEVALTSDACLALCWQCQRCGQDVVCRFPITDLIKDIPDPPGRLTDKDKEYLKELHIRLEDT